MSAETEAVIRELADRAAITQVLHTYARLVDEREYEAVAALFTDDCLADYGQGEGDTLRSAKEVTDWLTRQLRHMKVTSHHISNVEIRFTDADHADTVAYLYAWHILPGLDVDPVVLGRYVDRFVRTPAHGWRIAERRLFAHGLVGVPEGILRPLPRKDA